MNPFLNLILSAQLVGGSAQAQELQNLIVASAAAPVRTESGALAVQFTLENRSAKDVTAWEVDVRCTLSDGSIRSMSLRRETFASYAGADPPDARAAEKLLRAGGSTTGRVIIGPMEAADVSVIVRFAIFADRTALGDLRGISEVFSERTRIARAWTLILTSLQAGRATGATREGLEAALQYLNSPTQEDFDHPDKSAMRRSLEMGLNYATTDTLAQQFFEESLVRAQRTIEAANAHKR